MKKCVFFLLMSMIFLTSCDKTDIRTEAYWRIEGKYALESVSFLKSYALDLNNDGVVSSELLGEIEGLPRVEGKPDVEIGAIVRGGGMYGAKGKVLNLNGGDISFTLPLQFFQHPYYKVDSDNVSLGRLDYITKSFVLPFFIYPDGFVSVDNFFDSRPDSYITTGYVSYGKITFPSPGVMLFTSDCHFFDYNELSYRGDQVAWRFVRHSSASK